MPLQILIPVGLGIILIIVLIRLYPVLHIFLSKIIFGKFSSRYIATNKRYTSQSPYAYCIKDDFINHIAGFYKGLEKIQQFNSDQELTFMETDYGVSFNNVLKSNKKPFCINSNRLSLFDLKILGYRDLMFTAELKKYYYFIDKNFFLGQLTFKNPDKENIDKIIGVIRKKYLGTLKINSDDFIIHGKNNSVLLCQYNGFHLSLSYLSRAHGEINKLVDEYWNTSTNIKLRKTSSLEAELMNKL